MFEVVVPDLEVEVEFLEVSAVFFELGFGVGNFLDFEEDLVDLGGVDGGEDLGL